jgi:hypothetical protein
MKHKIVKINPDAESRAELVAALVTQGYRQDYLERLGDPRLRQMRRRMERPRGLVVRGGRAGTSHKGMFRHT